MTKFERVMLQPAYVLHHRPYRNTSALVEVFARDLGRVGMVARGVRSQRSPLQGILQPFCPLLLSWSGRGELGTLTAAETQGPVLRLRGKVLFCGYYLNELLLRLTPRHAPHPGLYHAYEATVHALEAAAQTAPGTAQQEQALRVFEKHLLHECGYGLLLEHEAEGERPIAPDRRYRFQLEKGPMPDEGSAGGIPVHGRTLLGLARGDLTDPLSLKEAKALMRAALSLYLGDKPLKSREFYQQASTLKIGCEPVDGP